MVKKMNYYTFPPPAKLAGYVKNFWVFESDMTKGDLHTHLSTASVYPKLTFLYKGKFNELLPSRKINSLFTMGVQGQTQRFTQLIATESTGVFGVYLFPHAIPRLFSIPASALSDQVMEWDYFLSDESRRLEEKMLLATNNRERLKIMTGFLEGLLENSIRYNDEVMNSIMLLNQKQGNLNIKEFTGQYALSQRQFERKFKEYTGFTPKKYARIIRFETALCQSLHQEKSLTEIAYDCGYYDQSHFIHEFKEFSGYHPKAYLANSEDLEIFKN
ncbi:helix-turn-helix transcriptional regulator [Rapidithrix thailandica]|uniref:Helix-turn-helix transcriptional regulator n=1 Tax=Rapidithrix thailandica TaxID=413964 RepID=A0AAW9RTI2_9BACT